MPFQPHGILVSPHQPTCENSIFRLQALGSVLLSRALLKHLLDSHAQPKIGRGVMSSATSEVVMTAMEDMHVQTE